MNVFLLFMILFHTLADFYFQSKRLSCAKRESMGWMLLHCLIYMAAVFIASYALGFLSVAVSGIFAAALGISHFVVDSVKQAVNRKWKTPKAILLAFVTGQTLHIAFLIAAILCVMPYVSAAPWVALIPDFAKYNKGLHLLTALLIGYTPTAILVKLVLDILPVQENDGVASDAITNPDSADAGGGRLIGILEREIMILLVFWQQFAAIGFIMAAKSIARYKQLEQQPFAEKYLVGTLTSVFMALLISLALGSL